MLSAVARIFRPMSVSSNVSARILADLTAVVGVENVLHHHDERLVYECDGYVIDKKVPDVVVFPTSTEHVVALVKLCAQHEIPFVPRGAGTSLAGGTLAIGGGVMICMTRDEQDPRNQHPRPLRRRPARRGERLVDKGASGNRFSFRAPTRQARALARSAAMSRRTPAARTR